MARTLTVEGNLEASLEALRKQGFRWTAVERGRRNGQWIVHLVIVRPEQLFLQPMAEGFLRDPQLR